MDSSLNALDTFVFCKSVIIDSVLENCFKVCANFWIRVVRPRPSRNALCGTPCTRKSIFDGFVCPALGVSTLDCCCTLLLCCTCQASFNTILGGGRGMGILWYKILSCLVLTTFSMQSAAFSGWSNKLRPGLLSICFCTVPFVVSINLHILRRVHCPKFPELCRRQSPVLLWCPFHLLEALLAWWSALFNELSTWCKCSFHPTGIST